MRPAANLTGLIRLHVELVRHRLDEDSDRGRTAVRADAPLEGLAEEAPRFPPPPQQRYPQADDAIGRGLVEVERLDADDLTHVDGNGKPSGAVERLWLCQGKRTAKPVIPGSLAGLLPGQRPSEGSSRNDQCRPYDALDPPAPRPRPEGQR